MADNDKPKSMIEKAVEQSEAEPLKKPRQNFVSENSNRLGQRVRVMLKKPEIRNSLIAVVAVVVVVIAAVMLYGLIHKPPFYKTISITNDGYTYSFKFADNAKVINEGTSQEATGDNLAKTSELQIEIFKSSVKENCQKAYAGLTVDFTSSIQGVNYPTCTNSSSSGLITNFEFNSTWHSIIITTDGLKGGVDKKTAQTIVSSISVNK